MKLGLLVTGHEHGEIAVWHDVIAWIQASSKGKGKAQTDVAHPVCSTLHWHAHPVASLALSPDGRYMFSGIYMAIYRYIHGYIYL